MMRLVLGGLNGKYLHGLVHEANGQTERVDAAIAYATNERLLFEWCWENKIPLRFWGRFDDEVPIKPSILDEFVSRASARYVCKVVRHFHPKVIWWHGFGAYIGSANLTDKAWTNNIEAGVFVTDDELVSAGTDQELLHFFERIEQEASPVTSELVDLLRRRQKEIGETQARDKASSQRQWDSGLVKMWSGLVHSSEKVANDARRRDFLQEWYSTLDILRGIAAKVTRPENRPSWVDATSPAGAQADQFLHAHYYGHVARGAADYHALYEANKTRADDAVEDVIAWWKGLTNAPSGEDETLNKWAPLLREMLSEARLPNLSESEFQELLKHVHASLEYSRRVPNRVIGLPQTAKPTREEKSALLASKIYNSHRHGGPNALNTLMHVLYGGPRDKVPDRLWDAMSKPELRVERLGVSSLGEIVGWAMPNVYPPRNGRTSKALRALGYPVVVHTGE